MLENLESCRSRRRCERVGLRSQGASFPVLPELDAPLDAPLDALLDAPLHAPGLGHA